MLWRHHERRGYRFHVDGSDHRPAYVAETSATADMGPCDGC
jgi:hypothetical protein